MTTLTLNPVGNHTLRGRSARTPRVLGAVRLRRHTVPTAPRLGSLTLGAYHPLVRHGWVRFPADRIFKAVVGALTPGGMEILEANERLAGNSEAEFVFDCQGVRDRLHGKLGFRLDEAERVVIPTALFLQFFFVFWVFFFV